MRKFAVAAITFFFRFPLSVKILYLDTTVIGVTLMISTFPILLPQSVLEAQRERSICSRGSVRFFVFRFPLKSLPLAEESEAFLRSGFGSWNRHGLIASWLSTKSSCGSKLRAITRHEGRGESKRTLRSSIALREARARTRLCLGRNLENRIFASCDRSREKWILKMAALGKQGLPPRNLPKD